MSDGDADRIDVQDVTMMVVVMLVWGLVIGVGVYVLSK
jgi:hypothetical protein